MNANIKNNNKISFKKINGDIEENRFAVLNFVVSKIGPLVKNICVKENLILIVIVILYSVAIYSVHILYGIKNRIVMQMFYESYTFLTIVFSFIFISIKVLNKTHKLYLNIRFLIGVLTIFLVAPIFKGIFASYKQTIPLIHNYSWDSRLMQFDRILHFGHDPWRLIEQILDYTHIVLIIDFLYIFWFVFLVLICLWMAWTRRRILRLEFFISTLLVWGVLGSGLGTVFSSVGPCYYSKISDSDYNPFEPLMAKLMELHQQEFLWAVKNQLGLWDAYENNIWLPFGGISAMPSIHLAMAMIFVMLGFSVHKGLGFFFTGYILIMQLGSVILGWHYAIDGYVGSILAFLIWISVKRIIRKLFSENF